MPKIHFQFGSLKTEWPKAMLFTYLSFRLPHCKNKQVKFNLVPSCGKCLKYLHDRSSVSETGGVPGGKIHECVASPKTVASRGFSPSCGPHSGSATHQNQHVSPLASCVPSVSDSPGVDVMVCPVTSLLWGLWTKLIFSLFSFFLFYGWKWKLPGSLMSELKPESPV